MNREPRSINRDRIDKLRVCRAEDDKRGKIIHFIPLADLSIYPLVVGKLSNSLRYFYIDGAAVGYESASSSTLENHLEEMAV